MGDRLTKIHLDATIIHERIVHFKVGFHGLLFLSKFHKGILQGSARIVISNNFGLDLLIKAAENEFQIFIFRDGI